MRAHLLVPEVPGVAVGVEARVPLGNQTPEVLPEDLLHAALQVHVVVVLALHVRQLELRRALSQARPLPPLLLWGRLRRRWRLGLVSVAGRGRHASTRRRRCFGFRARSAVRVLGVRLGAVLVLGALLFVAALHAALLLVHAHAPEPRAASADGEPMEVRVTPSARLEARHGQVGLLSRVGQHRRHNHAHGQLRAESDHVRGQVWRSANEVEAKIAQAVLVGRHGVTPELRPHVQPMNLVERVVLRIQRPPERRDSTKPVLVRNPMLVREKGLGVVVRAAGRSDPRRPPGQELHGGRELLTLEGPVHGRRTNVATDARDRADEGASLVLVGEHLAEPGLRQRLLPAEAVAVTAHGLTIDGEALASRLLQQRRVHQSPGQAIPVRAPSPRQPEEVLGVLGGRHGDVPVAEQVRDTHWELQREGLRETPGSARQRGLVVHRGPAVGERLRVLLRVGLLGASVAVAPRERAGARVAEHVGRADELLEHSANEVLDLVAIRQNKRGGA